MQCTGEFAAALTLFDFCTDGINAEKNARAASVLPLVQWRQMAGRDAGMALYHIGMSIVTVGEFVGQYPWLSSRLDGRVVKEAKIMMNERFRYWDEICHAIAHRSDFFIHPRKSQKHRITISQGVYKKHWNRLEGRVFTHTLNGKLVACEVSQDALDSLIEIRRKFFSAFDSAERRD